MKSISCLMFVLVLIAVAVGQEKRTAIEDFAFMAGCWEMSVPQRNMTISEQWMKPLGGTLIGMGRTVIGEKTVSYESLRIVSGDAGIDYIAKPSSNKDETIFKLTRSTATAVVFENPAHDFPQRIIYKKGDADSLFARIEGTRNGKLSGMDIPMKRVKCN